jgi:uncharacterized protein YukE
MSANRANASARNKRAGGAEIAPQQTGKGGQPQKDTQPQNPKISISDAIGLVTLRLGRLENFMYTINHEGLPSNDNNHELEENDRIVDDEVFRSIVSRLDLLEQKINSITQNKNEEQSFDNIEEQPLIKTIIEKQSTHQASLYDLKDAIFKLQSFCLETGERFTKFTEQYNEKIKELADKYDSIQENENNSLNDVDNNITINSNSLKELIKKELSEDNC